MSSRVALLAITAALLSQPVAAADPELRSANFVTSDVVRLHYL